LHFVKELSTQVLPNSLLPLCCVNNLNCVYPDEKRLELICPDGGVPGGGGGAADCAKPVCAECGRVYSSASNLKQHMANVHATAHAWEPCPVCGKHFKTRQYLFNHLLQTHGIRQRTNRMHAPLHHSFFGRFPSTPHSKMEQPHNYQ
jgi:uncharacterized C2H2 Zn-finger protein